ncbi:MAG: gamma-glutamyltransferase [Thermoproteus sp. AZ2]|uniref:Gamma-glutamyltransferase n=1 Tax=Thermoproteus sp. AZ2 TaxID=1609232 RepID=A0ACC6V0U9_9CREN
MSWGRKIALASESFLASYIGCKVAEMGGNEADVAVAVSLALSYLLPHLGGIGGDFLALVDDGNRIRAVMGLGWAPSGIGERPPRFGLRSAVVPGMPAGLAELHKAYGSIEWGRLVEAVVELLEERAVIHPSFAEALSGARLEGPGKEIYEALPRTPGAPYRIEPLISLYREMAGHGPYYFYEAMAQSLSGDYFSADDFRQYRAKVEDPISLEYRGWAIYEAPPPSLGFAVLLTLSLSANSLPKSPFSRQRIRTVISAARKAHWARDKYLGDVEVPVKELLTGRLELGEAEAPTPTPGTTYFAVVGKEMAISAIQSLYYSFGSGYVDRLGVVLNNRASDFTAGPNAPAPRKRPAHTLSAVLAVNGGDRLVLGASAGHYRPVIYAQLIQNFLDYGLEIRRAVWAPRFIWIGGWRAVAETGYEAGDGVEIVEYPSRLGVAAAAIKSRGALAAVADIRGDGASMAI